MQDHNKNPIQLGTVSRATMRPQDLIPCFLGELKALNKKAYLRILERIHSQDREVMYHLTGQGIDEDHSFWDEELCHDILTDLFDALDWISPPYAYFGAHEGDGSDYGFWPSHDAIEDAVHDGELLQVSDLSEIPDKFTGDICLINDHGNMAIGRALHGVFYSCWAIV